MKIASYLAVALVLALFGTAVAAGGPDPGAVFGQDFRPLRAVPDEKTAVLIAEAVIAPVFGEDTVRGERPFYAVLDKGVWQVDGTLGCEPKCVGGTAHVSIAMKDGRILAIFHTQ